MDDTSFLSVTSHPALRHPYVICGVEGTLNSGNVAVAGLHYLMGQFNATKFAGISTPRYHVYHLPGTRTSGPLFKMEDGLIVDSDFPADEFFYATDPASDHDLIFFLGSEPNLYLEEYTDTVVRLATEFGAARLYAFGSIVDRYPYGREPRITCTCTSKAIKDEMANCGVSYSNRQGSPTLNQMLLYSCKKKGLEGAALTVRSPYYHDFGLTVEYAPRSIRAVLMRLNDVMGLGINFRDLDSDIKDIEGKLDFFRQQNPRFNTYIEELDKGYVETAYRTGLDISANEAVRLAEEFLRESQDGHQGS
jgi:proteasome assembly chaperone (PAC2) family protein